MPCGTDLPGCFISERPFPLPQRKAHTDQVSYRAKAAMEVFKFTRAGQPDTRCRAFISQVERYSKSGEKTAHFRPTTVPGGIATATCPDNRPRAGGQIRKSSSANKPKD